MIKYLYILIICLFASTGWGATYNYYFSDDAQGNAAGNNTTGDGTQGTPWKTLQKAEDVMKVLNVDDVVYLWFDGGDQWDFVTNVLEVFSVETGDPTVHIGSYGTGRAIFAGDISDFSAAENNNTDDWHHYNRVFHFEVENCSIDNVEIKDVYGDAINLGDSGGASADGFTLSNSLIHNIGYSFINANTASGAENVTVEYNIMHTGQQLHANGKYPGGWGQGVSLMSSNGTAWADNMVQYNLIYDVGGEGIWAGSSTVQYNVIGDTSSIALMMDSGDNDPGTMIARYNLIIMSDWSSSNYDNLQGSPVGIRVFDESNCSPTCAGDNSGADISIYGNIVINRSYGIWIFNTADVDNPFGSVKIYNNLVIDSNVSNIRLANPDEFTELYFYNNASVFYDNAADDRGHVDSVTAGGGWNISHNLFYHKSGTHTIDNDFQTSYQTGDPLLPGDAAIDWGAQTGATYYNNIEYTTHLYPTSGPLINTGYNHSYEKTFLTTGSDFSDVLSWPTGLVTAEQNAYAQDEIGPWTYIGAGVTIYPWMGAKPDGAK